MDLYHILVSEGGQAVFAQKEEWGDYSTRMHALLTGEVRSVPGHKDVYYSFWNPANPNAALKDGWILLFIESETLVEAVLKVGPVWWDIKDMHSLRHPPAHSQTRPKFTPDKSVSEYQIVRRAPSFPKRKAAF